MVDSVKGDGGSGEPELIRRDLRMNWSDLAVICIIAGFGAVGLINGFIFFDIQACILFCFHRYIFQVFPKGFGVSPDDQFLCVGEGLDT